MWRQKDVVWAIFETILMALLGTIGTAIVTLPLAFLAAKNSSRLAPLRFARVFGPAGSLPSARSMPWSGSGDPA